MVITWLATSSHFGIGLDLGELIGNLGRIEGLLWRESTNPADRGLLNPNWPFLPETFAAMLEPHLPLDRAVQEYIAALDLTGGRAQAVLQRTMARLAEVHLPLDELQNLALPPSGDVS